MANDNINSWGTTSRALPGVTQDNALSITRHSRYGEPLTQSVAPGKAYAIADEGGYFVVTNPTIGTGLVGIAAADGPDDTETFLLVRNTSATQNLYLDYLRLQVTAAGTNGVTWKCHMKTDQTTSRYTSGGAALTPVNVNTNSTATPSCTVHAGPLITTAASSSARLIGEYHLRTGVIKVIGDTAIFNFGGNAGATGVIGVAGTAVAQLSVACPPVILAPNASFLFHEYGASQTVGAAYITELGFWMR